MWANCVGQQATILVKPYGTVEMFWREVDSLRRGTIDTYLFTDPQALIFQRVAPEPGIF